MTTTCTPVVSRRDTTASTCSCVAPGVMTTITVETLSADRNEDRLGGRRPGAAAARDLRDEGRTKLHRELCGEHAARAGGDVADDPAACGAHAHGDSDAAPCGLDPTSDRHRATAHGAPRHRAKSNCDRRAALAAVVVCEHRLALVRDRKRAVARGGDLQEI